MRNIDFAVNSRFFLFVVVYIRINSFTTYSDIIYKISKNRLSVDCRSSFFPYTSFSRKHAFAFYFASIHFKLKHLDLTPLPITKKGKRKKIRKRNCWRKSENYFTTASGSDFTFTHPSRALFIFILPILFHSIFFYSSHFHSFHISIILSFTVVLFKNQTLCTNRDHRHVSLFVTMRRKVAEKNEMYELRAMNTIFYLTWNKNTGEEEKKAQNEKERIMERL